MAFEKSAARTFPPVASVRKGGHQAGAAADFQHLQARAQPDPALERFQPGECIPLVLAVIVPGRGVVIKERDPRIVAR
jgi:hypothetical protein